MLNAPVHTLFSDPERSDELIAPGSPWRLWVTGSVFLAAVAVVLGRVAWIQTQLRDVYLESLLATTVEEELIPARDGRILAGADVLATDTEHFALQIHFRWLQATADPNWLRLQVRQKLSREERRHPALVAAAEREILRLRMEMQRAVCDVTGVPPEEFAARCERVEQRVGRIIDAVNRRQSSSSAAADEPDRMDSDPPGWLIRFAASVRDALTTPPQRETEERVVVREEESWHTILDDLPLDQAARISEQPERFPGVRLVQSTERVYPNPDLAVHVVGARIHSSADRELSGSPVQDTGGTQRRKGEFGVEKTYSLRLNGVPGLRRTVRDRRQRIVSSEIVRRPVSGQDVTLTLDPALQQLAEQLLEESLGDTDRRILLESDEEETAVPEPAHIPTGGCVVVMEADSGRLLAAASAPDFHLSMFTDGSPSQWEAVNSDVRRPFVSRITGMALPPGSTFKIVTAIAGLQSGIITPETTLDCQGFLTNPEEHRCLIYRLHGHGHGPINLKSALAQSCNVYFFDAARRMGTEPLSQWAAELEFGRPTGVDLPFEKAGNLPKAHNGESGSLTEVSRRRFEREALGFAIGQSRLTVTPLQMARLLACVANGGWLVTPHVVSDEGVARTRNEAQLSINRLVRRRITELRPETLMAIREGLKAAVEESVGTGFRTVRVPGIPIAGKTGTAEAAPGKPDHAWFAGYVPANSPKYVVVAVLEHGGSGSRAAGPIVREIVRYMGAAGLTDNVELTHSPGD